MTTTGYGTDVTTTPCPDDALTVREAAMVLDRTTDHVRGLVRSGTLPGWIDEHDQNYRTRRGDVEALRDGKLDARPSQMFADFEEIEAERVALVEARKANIAKRNRRMVEWSDRGASTTAIAQAARLGRQHAHAVLEKTRAELAQS